MKKISFLLLIQIIVFGSVLSQAPKSFNYQAIARDIDGNVISDKYINLRISLLGENETGAPVYSETHGLTTNRYGLIKLEIGKGENKKGMITDIKWEKGKYFVQLEMDLKGGSDFVIMGVSQLLSVPYALYAESSGNDTKEAMSWTDAGSVTYLTNSANDVGIGTSSPASKLDVVGQGSFENVYGTRKDLTTASGHVVANKFEVQYEPTSSSAVKGSSLQIKAITADPANTDFTEFLQGLRFSLIHRNNGTISQLTGGRFQMGMPSGTWGGTGTTGTVTSLKGIDMELYGQKGTIEYGTGISLESIGTNFSNLTYLRINQETDVAGNYGIYNNSDYDNYIAGKVGIGSASPKAALEINSSTDGFLPSRMTTAQMEAINSPPEGLTIYNTTLKVLCWYNGSTWMHGNEGQSCGILNYEGRNYSTVIIAKKCWMAQNLNVGKRISYSKEQIDNDTIEKYCYDNTPANCVSYGGLYQWGEVMKYVDTEGTQGICPNGWHVPTEDEWCTLANYVDVEPIICSSNGWQGVVAAGNLKKMGNLYWNTPNTGATDKFGFSALGAGVRTMSPVTTQMLNQTASFWTSTKFSPTMSRQRSVGYNSDQINGDYVPHEFGFSLRCIKDDN